MNAQKYLDNFNVNPIFEKILKKYNINKMENNYSRHLQELKKKYLSLTADLVHKNYFDEMPLYYDELLQYVIVLNTPFIDEAKRKKYQVFLERKSLKDFKDFVKEYIFPYKDSDKDKLGDNAILILKMDSVEYAIKAAEALNNVALDKSHTSIALTYNDFEKIEKLPKKYEEK